MSGLFGALFLAILIWLIISILRIIMAAKRQTRSFFNQFSGTAQQPNYGEQSRKEGWYRPAMKKSKKIDRDTGEYVEFEEIISTHTSVHSAAADERKHAAKESRLTESQITDGEWEDI